MIRLSMRWSIIFMLSFLFACGDPVPENYNASQKPGIMPKTVKKIDPSDVSSRFTTKKNVYFYDPDGKRNPFKPYDLNKDSLFNIIESPLEKYQLGELSLVGVIWGIADPRGMIKAPDGETYVVRRMSRIGRNKGKVSRVSKSSIYVEEEYRDPAGNIATKETKLELKENSEEALSGGLKIDE